MSIVNAAPCSSRPAAARAPWALISGWLARRAARARHYRVMRELAQLPYELQRDIGVGTYIHLPPPDARTLDHQIIKGTYW